MKNVQTVIWDCDGVMWFYKKPEEEVAIISEVLKVPYSKEFEDEYMNLLSTFDNYFAKHRTTTSQYYRLIEETMPILSFFNVSIEQFVKIWNEIQVEISILNKDIQVVLEYLKNKGIKSIVKTDWWRDAQITKMKGYGLIDYIEEIHACDNGYLKTNPISTADEIIRNGNKGEYVIVGDRLDCDINYAQRSGIKSIWFNKDGKDSTGQPYHPTAEISSLLEIMQIL